MKFTMITWSSMDNIYPEDISVDSEAFKNHFEDILNLQSRGGKTAECQTLGLRQSLMPSPWSS
jgi:hypothetical protein